MNALLAGQVERIHRIGRSLPEPPVLLGWLIVAHVVLKVLVFALVWNSPPYGDEQAYLNGSMALSNTLRDLFGFQAPDWAELDRNLVASGWFMPGMSILIAPLYLLFPHAGLGLVRGYLGSVMLALFVLVLRAAARTLGYRWACVLAVVPGLIPAWVLFTYGAWGDLAAGLTLVLLVLRLIEMFRAVRAGDAPRWRDGIATGLLAVATLYLRSSTIVLLGGLGVLMLAASVLLVRGAARRWRAVGSAALAGVIFVLLIAPWSVYASHVLDGRVITTTTVPTVKANTFGERDDICFGVCDPDSTMWFRPVRYAREVGAATGTSEVDVLKVMSDYALRDVTLAGYLGQVDHNLAAYSLIPTTFVDHLEPEDGRSVPGIGWAWAVKIGTWLSYYPLLLLAAASLLTFARRSLEARLLDVAVKLSIGALLVQPFVHISGGRYWTTAAPFFGIAAATFLRERRIRTGQDAAPAAGVLTATDTIVVTWLGRVQVLLRAATVAVAVVLAAGLVLAAALLL